MRSILQADDKLILYHSDSSYYSQIVRLVLAEKGPLAWIEQRSINIDDQLEQLDPWYAKINPEMTVPTLQLQRGQNIKNVCGSDKIVFFLEENFVGKQLVQPTLQSEVNAFVKLHYAIPVDIFTIGSLLHRMPFARESVKNAMNQRNEKMKVLALDYRELEDQYDRKIKINQEKLRKFFSEQEYREVKQKIMNALNLLDDTLSQKELALKQMVNAQEQQLVKASNYSNPKQDSINDGVFGTQSINFDEFSEQKKEVVVHTYLVGNSYSIADAIWTVFLAHVQLCGHQKWIVKRSALNRYYSQMQQRESFVQARVQKRIGLQKIFGLLRQNQQALGILLVATAVFLGLVWIFVSQKNFN